MTFSIANNAGDETVKTFHLVKASFNAVHYVIAASNTSPIVIQTATEPGGSPAAHGLTTGTTVTVTGVGGNTGANGSHVITWVSATEFSIPVAGTAAYTSGGAVIRPAIQYWTDSDVPLTALGQTWSPMGVVIGGISAQGTEVTGSNITFAFQFENDNYVMSRLVYNPRTIKNVPIDIYEAWIDPTVTSAIVPGGLGVDVKYLLSGIISSGVLNRQGSQAVATFQLALDIDQNAIILPRRMLTQKCTVLYKGAACGYAGNLETCTRTLTDCAAHSNQTRYGGFPMLPTVK